MIKGLFIPSTHGLSTRLLAKFIFIQFVIILCLSSVVFGSGKITGKVVDAESGEPILGASVYLKGTKTGAASDLDGNFIVKKVDEGTYTLIVSSIGYEILNITNVEMTTSQTITLNFVLEPKSIIGKKIVVSAKSLKNTEAHLLIERQKAASISDAISAEAMSRSGSGNAAEAMTRVTGASVVDGKYIYIRGLGGRYSNTTIDGANIPNANPDEHSVQMNLFATNLLDNVVVEKTFTPDKPGDFSGGSVQLQTKDLPEQLTMSFSSSVSHNSNVTGKDGFLSSPRSNLEWLGFDNSFRDLPDELNDPSGVKQNTPIDGSLEDGLAADVVHKSFNTTFSQKPRQAPPGQSYSFSFGNTYSVNERPLGVLAGLTYKRSYSFYSDGTVARYDLTQPDAPNLDPQYIVPDVKATEKVQWGGLGKISYSIHENHKLSTRFVYNREGEQENRYIIGYQSGSTMGYFQTRTLQYIEQYVGSFQLEGEHFFKPLKMDWRFSYSKSNRNEPDLRYFTNDWYLNTVTDSVTGDTLSIDTVYSLESTGTGYFPVHVFREIDVRNREFQLNFSLPLTKRYSKPVKLSFGASYLDKERVNSERRFKINYTDPNFDGNPDHFVNNEDMGIDWENSVLNEIADINDSLEFDSAFIVKTEDTLFDNQGNIIFIFPLPEPFFDTIVTVDTLRWDTISVDTTYTFVYKKNIEESLITAAQNNFKGNRDVLGAYLMMQLPILRNLRFIGGTRYETTDMEIRSSINDGLQGSIDAGDWLPSASFTYALTDRMNLRLAYGRTLARPTFKEKSKLITYEFMKGLIFNGNPDLTYTTINNLDFRWEWFNGPGRIIAASAFYKRFKHPIERAYWGPNNDITYVNVDRANVFGLELEIRQSLELISRWFSNFKFESNFTYSHSRIDIPEHEMGTRIFWDSSASDTRQLQGQSPYILNLGLTYENYETKTVASLMFNIFGKRLSLVGRGGIPDVFEQPRPMLDMTLSQRIWGAVSLKLSAKNLLNEKVSEIITYKDIDYTFREYSIGRSISFGLSYKI